MKSEAAVQREVVRYLKAHGWEVYPVGQWIAKRTQRAGVFDLWCMHPHFHLFAWVEVKNGAGGRVSKEQKQFREWCIACGVPAHIVTCWQDVRTLVSVDYVLGVKDFDSNHGHNHGEADRAMESAPIAYSPAGVPSVRPEDVFRSRKGADEIRKTAELARSLGLR